MAPTFVGGQPTHANQLQNNVDRGQVAGYAFQILPYMELTNIWNPQGGTTILQKYEIMRRSAVPSYACPTRRAGAQNMMLDTNIGPEGNWGYNIRTMMVDYGSNSYTAWGWESQQYGVTPWAKGIPIGAITDGTSNVFMVGEKRMPSRMYLQPTGDQDFGVTDGWDPDVVRIANIGDPHNGSYVDANGRKRPWNPNDAWLPIPDNVSYGVDGRSGWNSADWGDWRFGGPHPEKFLMAFADASVHPIPYNIDPVLWMRLANRSDGDSVELP